MRIADSGLRKRGLEGDRVLDDQDRDAVAHDVAVPPVLSNQQGVDRLLHAAPGARADGSSRDVPVERVHAVLRREGRSLAYYGVANGPQGYKPLRDFLAAKLKRDAGIDCTADDVLLVSGSLQAFDLINGALLAPGDTVIVERDTYQGMLTRYARAGVNAVGIPLDEGGLRMDALDG